MQHESAHGPMAVIEEPGMMVANVLKSGTLEHIMPLVTQMHARAQRGYKLLGYINGRGIQRGMVHPCTLAICNMAVLTGGAA